MLYPELQVCGKWSVFFYLFQKGGVSLVHITTVQLKRGGCRGVGVGVGWELNPQPPKWKVRAGVTYAKALQHVICTFLVVQILVIVQDHNYFIKYMEMHPYCLLSILIVMLVIMMVSPRKFYSLHPKLRVTIWLFNITDLLTCDVVHLLCSKKENMTLLSGTMGFNFMNL